VITRLFARLARFSVGRPWLVIALSAVAAALSVGAAARMPIRTSNLDLIDPELPEVRRFLQFAEEFGTPNVLVVTFEGEDAGVLEQAVDHVGHRLRALEGVRTVLDGVPYDRQVLRDLGVDPYLASTDRKLFMIFVQPADTTSSADTIAPLVEDVRRVLGETPLAALGVRAGMTGIPVYALDDREVIQRDMSKLSILAFVLVAVLFVASFRSLRRPLLAMTALLAGVVFTVGFITLYPGHLTLLSAFFASSLFGLGIDYGIHIINRVEELVADGVPEREAVPRAVEVQARELFTAALTTAFGFFAMTLSGFRGFEELGVIAGVGVLLCLLAMITLLPALLVIVPGRWRQARPFTERRLGRLLLFLQRPWLAGALALGVLALAAAGGPGFDSDYLNLEPRASEAVRLEREIAKRSDFSTQFAVFVTGSRARADEIANRALDDETVGVVRSLADLDMLRESSPDRAPFPEYFERGFASTSGHYAVYVYPRGDIWNPERQQAFLRHMRAIDPSVTGMPFLGSFMVQRSQRALYITGALCGILLVLSVAMDLRRPLPVLLAITPTVLTVFALRGLLRLLEIPLNPLNVMALPIVLGIAVDNGVYLVHRFLDEQGDLLRSLAGTGRSILMTSSTTLAGFGSLLFTSHRGLASFAAALTLGVASALVISLVVLPELLRLLKPRLVR
jgi:predicted RND superfamily exporter protein